MTAKSFKKKNCIKNAKTRRCIKSSEINNTSPNCEYFNKTNRCRNKNTANFISYNNFKIKPSVKSFINKNIINKSAKKMRDIANNNGLYIPLDDYSDDNDMKEYIIGEILELSENHERDHNQSNIISLKTVKHIISDDAELKLIINKV